MNWIELNHVQQLADIKNLSETRAQVIFKHSTRCSISSMAKNRLERNPLPASTDFYYLDLIKNRNISNQIAEDFNVHHESPQILLIKNKDCLYTESHNGIQMDELLEELNIHNSQPL